MKKLIPILLLIPIIFILHFLYREINSFYITASFKDLRPFHGNIPVYYKGIKIGKAKDIKHSNSYEESLLRIQIYGRKHKIPDNAKVYLKKEVRGKRHYDYLELVMPETPSGKYIKENSWLEGKCSIDIEHFLRNQEPDDIENLRANIVKASENLNETLESVAGLFGMAEDMLAENRPALRNSVNNLEYTTQNVTTATQKVNNAISEEQLSETLLNIQNASSKTYSITESIVDTSMVGVNEIITKTNCILDDTNCITKGIRRSMSKPFGGLRLMFGKVVD